MINNTLLRLEEQINVYKSVAEYFEEGKNCKDQTETYMSMKRTLK